MESQSLITINKQPLSFVEVLNYLRATGDDQFFILKILRQHLIETELSTHNELEINTKSIEKAMIEFRAQNNLNKKSELESWLKEKGFKYKDLKHKIETKLKVEKLKIAITNSHIREYFEGNKKSLEQVVLSRIIVTDENFAKTLKSKIQDEGQSFETLARENSLTSDKYTRGMMLPMMLGQLPGNLKEQISVTPPGQLIGPVKVDGGYCLLRVEEFIPASLDDEMKQKIQDQLFEQWLAQKLQNAEVKLHVL
ncbi:MAG: peptidylprolyl isomerase [Spirulinaceae cyanobacterium]